MARRRKAPATRHIVSINDLSDNDIENVFKIAEAYLNEFPDPNFPYRIGRSTNIASDFILASLFYEPSTRTRLSFESAMLRLGGRVITSSDPNTSSAAKGETLADTVRVIGNYADVIVIRHNRDGAARLAAEYSTVPIINGGDGSHEHPTQTLCDIFTLKKRHNDLKGLNVAISGDLKGSRTIHSFVYALARFNANILLMPAKGMELPAHVDNRLRSEFRCLPVPRAKYETENASIDALYVTPDEPHQLSLMPNVDIAADVKINKIRKIHAMYVTRFQKERWADKAEDYPKINAKFLKGRRYAETSVLHPLPRVDELDAALDNDERAMYFEQAAYGVPIRMALLSLLLNLDKKDSLERFDGGFERPKYAIYDQANNIGIRCRNKNCIVHDEAEGQYARNKFFVVATARNDGSYLRCFYCETDIERFVVAHKKNKWYTKDTAALLSQNEHQLRELIIFADETAARDGGFHHFKRNTVNTRPGLRKALKSHS
jgi:aspartate carbamoyltransferase catalytic subunit